eukprot:TRINITY_DN2315_c0_g1_i1.p1 TRINITY_DN2315_c0_g1~~TRINITY_DN2315_c0_g1_i1.p1  ORF type:complete len:371 (-),score=76.48 TRINITY_DN2315_c0_g1_i1:21-1133(-)
MRLNDATAVLSFTVFIFACAAIAATPGNITYVFTLSGNASAPIDFQCSNSQWTAFGLTFSVYDYINGSGPFEPMTDTGLPTIDMKWFVSGAASTYVNVSQTFNIANVTSSGNVVSFELEDNQPSIGGKFSTGNCTSGQTQPSITVMFSTNSYIVGLGSSNPAVAAISGIPTIVNDFPASNNAGGSVGSFTSISPTAAPTAQPTVAPTLQPTIAPTLAPTTQPSTAPTVQPTIVPSLGPTTLPSAVPTAQPSFAPTAVPTVLPTAAPTFMLTASPTSIPSVAPTVIQATASAAPTTTFNSTASVASSSTTSTGGFFSNITMMKGIEIALGAVGIVLVLVAVGIAVNVYRRKKRFSVFFDGTMTHAPLDKFL